MRKKYLGAILIFLLLSSIILFRLYVNEKKVFSIIFIPKVIEVDNDFWNLVIEGVKEAGNDYQIELRIMAPAEEGDYNRQRIFIEKAIVQKPDAIILAAEDYEKNTVEARKIKESGIKLIILDSGIKNKPEDIMIGTDNFEAGIKMGDRIEKLLTEEGQIAIMSHGKNTLTAVERERGIRTALKNIQEQIIKSYDCGSDVDKAYENTVKIINECKNIEVIVGLNQYTAVGAARAVKEFNLSDKIQVVGFDNSKEQIKYLEEGIYDSLVIQKPFYMGYISVEKTVQLLQGKDVATYIDTGSTVITKENMYSRIHEKLLFPF